MAAIIHPHRPVLTVVPAGRPQAPRRPTLRSLEGGRSAAARQRQLVFWRRRALVLALVLFAAVAVGLVVHGMRLVFADPAPSVSPTAAAAAAPLPADGTYVVRAGDTVWSIAARLAPDDDPRPIVDELTRRLGGRPLHVGERIDLGGLAS